MKKKIFNVLLAVVMVCSFSLVMAMPAVAIDGTVPHRVEAITLTADRLVDLQGTDGGWDWVVTGLTVHSEVYPSPSNLFGVTALGLINAYQVNAGETYYDATLKTADHLKTLSRAINSSVRFQTFDYRFLVEFSALSGDTSYVAHALSEWNWVKANVASFYADGNQETIYNFWATSGGASPGFAAWQASDAGLAALAMGDESWAENMVAVLAPHLTEITNTDIYRFIGWGHTLEFLNAVDPVTYNTQITSLISNLTGSQNADGSWGNGENAEGYSQDVAYAIMGLVAVGEGSVAQAGADWLVTNQGYNSIEGGWNNSTNNEEYSESDSEALQALVATLAPVTIDGEGYYSIQSAINSANLGDTINVVAGTYVEDLGIDATKTGLMLVGNDATIKGVAMTPWDEFPTVAPNINILADEVSISGFTIQGIEVTPGFYSSGICIGGSNVEIFNNDFEVTNAGSMDDIGQAIQTYNKLAIPGVDVSGLNIHDNTFASYGEGDIGFEGIYINRDEGTGSISITGNTFTGDIFRGITSERSNTAISDNSLITDVPSNVCWQGVLVRDGALGEQDNVSIVSNTVSGFGDGIRVGTDGQVLTNISVVGNEISNCVKGIWVLTAEDVTIAENTVSDTIGEQNTSVAILVESTDFVAIQGNTVDDFVKGGIVVKDTDSVQIEGNTVINTNYGMAPNGIQIGYIVDPTATTGTITGNQVSGCKWEGYVPEETYDGENNWTSSGILVIAPNSVLTISGNEVQDNDVGLDIEAGIGTSATGNDVHNNSYGFVLWNADPTINLNSIYQNALGGVYRTTAGETEGSLDATNNWWGHSSGVGEVGKGSGDAVSANVDYEPWLLEEGGDTFDMTRSLPTGWSLVSPDSAITLAELVGDGVKPVLVLEYTGDAWVSELSEPSPLKAIYAKTVSGGGVGVNYAEIEPGVIYSKELVAGWNLVSVPDTIASTQGILSQLRYATFGTQQGVGLTTLVSEGDYNQNSPGFYLPTLTDADWDVLPILSPLDGYWAYMEATDTFEVIPD